MILWTEGQRDRGTEGQRDRGTEGQRDRGTVITYGTFDMLHYGHINLLRRARELGDRLIVGLSTDEFNSGSKNKACYFSYVHRKCMLDAICYVDMVIPETCWEQKVTDIRDYHIDTFVIGDDWKGRFDFLKQYCNVVYLERTPGVSTTSIKESLYGKGGL